MAIFTTLFAATLAELEDRFPNVGDPLPAPRVVTRTNPFTKLPLDVEVYEPEFGPPRHERSLHAEDDVPPKSPVHLQADKYGQYLYSLVPQRLRSLPHMGAKNVFFSDAENLLQLGNTRPEKYVACLAGEGCVEVASARLVETLKKYEARKLRQRFPEASEAIPLEWLRALLFASSGRRYLCAWFPV
jgi:hypothetical protein